MSDGPPLAVIIAAPVAGTVIAVVIIAIVCCLKRRKTKRQQHRVSKKHMKGSVNAAYDSESSKKVPVMLTKSESKSDVPHEARAKPNRQQQTLDDSQTTHSGDSGFGDNEDTVQEDKTVCSKRDSLEEALKNYPRHDSECEFCTIGSFKKSQPDCKNPNCQRQASMDSTGSYYVNVKYSLKSKKSNEKIDVLYCNEITRIDKMIESQNVNSDTADTADTTYDHIDLKHARCNKQKHIVTHCVLVHNAEDNTEGNVFLESTSKCESESTQETENQDKYADRTYFILEPTTDTCKRETDSNERHDYFVLEKEF